MRIVQSMGQSTGRMPIQALWECSCSPIAFQIVYSMAARVATRMASSAVVPIGRRSFATAPALAGMNGKHFLSLEDFSASEISGLLDLAVQMKSGSIGSSDGKLPMAGKSLAMIFQKRSTRTRVSTETGMFKLGGHALFLGSEDIQVSK